MNKSAVKRKTSLGRKASLESRGWKEVLPGMYVGNGHAVDSTKHSGRVTHPKDFWDQKFEEAKAAAEGLASESDLD